MVNKKVLDVHFRFFFLNSAPERSTLANFRCTLANIWGTWIIKIVFGAPEISSKCATISRLVNGFAFIFQDHGWTFANGSLNYSLFYKDLLHLIEQGNVKLAKSISLTISSQYNHINLSSANSNMSHK